jgi:thioredoxin 1
METFTYILIAFILFVVVRVRTLSRLDSRAVADIPVTIKAVFADRSPIPETSVKVHKITSAAELDVLLASNANVVVDFYADWCPPCRAIAPVFSKLADTHALAGRLAFAKVNVDHVSGVAGQYSVTAMPTFMVFQGGAPKGVAVDGLKGRQSVSITSDGLVDKIRGADGQALNAVVQALAAGEKSSS